MALFGEFGVDAVRREYAGVGIVESAGDAYVAAVVGRGPKFDGVFSVAKYMMNGPCYYPGNLPDEVIISDDNIAKILMHKRWLTQEEHLFLVGKIANGDLAPSAIVEMPVFSGITEATVAGFGKDIANRVMILRDERVEMLENNRAAKKKMLTARQQMAIRMATEDSTGIIGQVNVIGLSSLYAERILVMTKMLWTLYGRMPTGPEVSACLPGSGIQAATVEELFRDKVALRFFRENDMPQNPQIGLSAKQALLIAILTNPNDTRTINAKLKDVGVTDGEYQQWLMLPIFKTMLGQFSEEMLMAAVPMAHSSLLKQVARGNMTAIGLLYQITGRYNPADRSATDVKALMGQVIDIISRNVSNPQQLLAIAEQLESVTSGRPAVAKSTQPLVIDSTIDGFTPATYSITELEEHIPNGNSDFKA